MLELSLGTWDHDRAMALHGCCQTNSNSSLQGQYDCPLCLTETAPLNQSGGAVEFEIRSSREAAFLIKVIVD